MGLFRSIARRLHRNNVDAFATQRRLIHTHRPVIFDVGAHVGQTALRYRGLFPDADIHCFEPYPASFATLVAATSGDDRIHAHAVALGDSDGAATLHANRSSATNSLLESDPRAVGYWGDNLLTTDSAIEVAVTTLDAFCAKNAVPHIDLLKIDVQGAEYSVLRGAEGLLHEQGIDVIYMEMITAPTYLGQHDLHEYLALFRKHGYVLFDFYNPVRANGRLLQTDNLMVAQRFLSDYESRLAAAAR